MHWDTYSCCMPKLLQPNLSSPIRDAFALRLQKLRRDYGKRLGRQLSQSAFAALLGIEGARLGSYERGDRTPTLEVLAALRRVTGVSLDELIAGPAVRRYVEQAKNVPGP